MEIPAEIPTRQWCQTQRAGGYGFEGDVHRYTDTLPNGQSTSPDSSFLGKMSIWRARKLLMKERGSYGRVSGLPVNGNRKHTNTTVTRVKTRMI